jgi:hypothetical protein
VSRSRGVFFLFLPRLSFNAVPVLAKKYGLLAVRKARLVRFIIVSGTLEAAPRK